MTVNKPDRWMYRAEVKRIIDGDTIDVLIRWDIGFKIVAETYQRIRLARIDAPEVRGPERPRGLEATEWLKKELGFVGPHTTRVVMLTDKDPDVFGRYIAEIWLDDEVHNLEVPSINDRMVTAGHAEYRDY